MIDDKSYTTSIIILVTLLLGMLKLTHVINWSWWWVLSPLLIWAGVALVALVIVLLIAFYVYS